MQELYILGCILREGTGIKDNANILQLFVICNILLINNLSNISLES